MCTENKVNDICDETIVYIPFLQCENNEHTNVCMYVKINNGRLKNGK